MLQARDAEEKRQKKKRKREQASWLVHVLTCCGHWKNNPPDPQLLYNQLSDAREHMLEQREKRLEAVRLAEEAAADGEERTDSQADSVG